MFQKDVNKVMELLQENEISLDEKKLEKYYFYIRQIEKLQGGHKCPLEREEVTKIVFVRRAIRYFLGGDHQISERVRITQRTNPQYIKRDCMYKVHMDLDQKAALEKVAEEQHCKMSQVFFQVMLDYCTCLIEMDHTGIEVKNRE